MRGVLFFLVSSASARSTFFFLLAQRGSRGVPLQATYSLTKIVDLWHTIPCLLFLFRPNFHSLKISHSAKLFTARYRLSRTSYSGFKINNNRSLHSTSSRLCERFWRLYSESSKRKIIIDFRTQKIRNSMECSGKKESGDGDIERRNHRLQIIFYPCPLYHRWTNKSTRIFFSDSQSPPFSIGNHNKNFVFDLYITGIVNFLWTFQRFQEKGVAKMHFFRHI